MMQDKQTIDLESLDGLIESGKAYEFCPSRHTYAALMEIRYALREYRANG
jgi:hypothetical protein